MNFFLEIPLASKRVPITHVAEITLESKNYNSLEKKNKKNQVQ